MGGNLTIQCWQACWDDSQLGFCCMAPSICSCDKSSICMCCQDVCPGRLPAHCQQSCSVSSPLCSGVPPPCACIGCCAVLTQEVRILNHATWNPMAQLSHPASLEGPAGVVVYKEISEAPSVSVRLQPRKSRYILRAMPAKIPQQKVPLDKPHVRPGLGECMR